MNPKISELESVLWQILILFAVFAVLAGFLSGCGPQHRPPDPMPGGWTPIGQRSVWHVDPSTDPNDLRRLREAAWGWNQATGVVIEIEAASWLEWEAANYITVTPTVNLGSMRCYYGNCQMRIKGTSDIWISGLTSGNAFRITALHEFGHALGLNHTDDGIMRAWVGWGSIECIELQALENLRSARPLEFEISDLKPTCLGTE